MGEREVSDSRYLLRQAQELSPRNIGGRMREAQMSQTSKSGGREARSQDTLEVLLLVPGVGNTFVSHDVL